MQVFCETQEEIDYYWSRLSPGGEEGNCGWLKDKFGVSWQVIPSILPELLNDPEKSERVTRAFLQMKKFEIKKLLKARKNVSVSSNEMHRKFNRTVLN